MFIETDFEIQTAGDGLWSNKKKTVNIKKIEIIEDKEYDHVYVNLFFTKKSWDVNKYGLIYTDSLFLEEAKAILSYNYRQIKLKWKNLNYTEQGMQGDNYVSMEL